MKRLIILVIFELCLSTPCYADPEQTFMQMNAPLTIRAEITTVSSMTMTNNGTIINQGAPTNIQPTITIQEAFGPTLDGSQIFVKNIQVDF